MNTASALRSCTMRNLLLAALLLTAALSFISPPYPNELLLQHIPTLLGTGLLIWYERRFGMSMAAFSCSIAFLFLHVVGARWIYSYVPYDAWFQSLFGFTISGAFGFHRNHYDRLVHFCYGLLLSNVVREIALRRFGLRPGVARFIAVEFIMASSMLYELFEYLIAVLLSPESAEAYNGQQGDMWDAQKDMALAMFGALLTIGAVWLRERRATAGPAI
ncbi:MAG: DUF2238 domain-containing protein [Bacteroidetes bacterium]|nr:DUF2238 domain-containing protein [Bacteroidota bacterium]